MLFWVIRRFRVEFWENSMKRPETGFFAGLSVALTLYEQHNRIYIVIGSKYFYSLVCES